MLMVHTYLELNGPHPSPDQEDISLVDGTVGLKKVWLQKHIKQIAAGKVESMNNSYMTKLIPTIYFIKVLFGLYSRAAFIKFSCIGPTVKTVGV